MPGGLGVPGNRQVRDLSRMRNVTPGEEAPAPEPTRCVAGLLGCHFDPPHVHGAKGGVVSPACSNCAAIWRGEAEDFEAYYDALGRCPACQKPTLP